mgnify:CR=1 FL=1
MSAIEVTDENGWQEAPDLDAVDTLADEIAPGPMESADIEELAPEPLFSSLLRRAVVQLWGADPVMHDFVTYVAPLLSDQLGHVTAKGGDFVLAKLEEGVNVSRYQDDQSMRAHLVNGLFPVLHVASTLQNWGAPQFRYYDDTVRRVLIAGYVLHDWLKLPEVDNELTQAGLRHDQVNVAQHRSVVETILRRWCYTLGLEPFLQPIGGVDTLLHDLIFVACNTQLKWGTLRNLAALPNLNLHTRQLSLAENLSRLADYLAYIGRDPRQLSSNPSIHREISLLSDQRARLVYQHIADVRGVLTNLIQNAALDAVRNDDCVPLLYAPSGVVYLARKEQVDSVDPQQVAEAVVQRVKQVASRRLAMNLTGFGRDGKGMKYADYYDLFFDKTEMLAVGIKATFSTIHENKKASAGKRFAKMREGAWMAPEVDLNLPDDVRVDQLAEWAYLAEKIVRDQPGGSQAPKVLIEAMGLGDLYDAFLHVPRDTRAGGVGYHWYFAAGHFLKRNPGLDPQQWEAEVRRLAQQLASYLSIEQQKVDTTATPEDDGFADLRHYVQQVLTFGPAAQENSVSGDQSVQIALFQTELSRYSNAKKRGRGTTSMCSLCSSPYEVTKQQEAAILFAPQVYSNKLSLHSSNAIRDICSICGLELMLRQLLMNRTNSTGGRFEGRNLRYLYFYPTYFFTPETLAMFHIVYDRLKRISFTELRKQIVVEEDNGPELRIDPVTWQRLEPLMLTADELFDPNNDRYLRMHFPDNEPITFHFLGVPPPGRDSKDAEAWVHPAFLALLLPLCIDVKVVASESSMPLLNEANELPETIFLDGAHAAIGYLARTERINLDHVLPTLNRLAVSYLIHMDGNSSAGSSGYDYRWQDLPALARHLAESPLYAFHYLKQWQRNARLDSLPPAKVRLYLTYYQHIAQEGGDNMNHARALTELFWKFYRARRKQGRLNSNSILRPLSVAATALLSADRRIFNDPESLTTLVRGELSGFLDRVDSRRADGYIPKIEVDGRKVIDEQAVSEFANYWVNTLYFGALRGDLSALRGKQLNLLKNACEVIYRDLDTQYWAEQGKQPPVDETDGQAVGNGDLASE